MTTNAPFYWARVKPYNPKRGQLVQRIKYMGKLWTGGDGVTTIPVWVKVNGAQRRHLLELHQIDSDPDSKLVFDIVTDEQRKRIDAVEENFRRAYYGQSMSSVQPEMPNIAAMETEATDRKKTGGVPTLEELQDAPDPSDGDVSDSTMELPVDAQSVRISAAEEDATELTVPGRAAALAGVVEASEDLNAALSEEASDLAPTNAGFVLPDEPAKSAEAPSLPSVDDIVLSTPAAPAPARAQAHAQSKIRSVPEPRHGAAQVQAQAIPLPPTARAVPQPEPRGKSR